jgi:hypothetical protein
MPAKQATGRVECDPDIATLGLFEFVRCLQHAFIEEGSWLRQSEDLAWRRGQDEYGWAGIRNKMKLRHCLGYEVCRCQFFTSRLSMVSRLRIRLVSTARTRTRQGPLRLI